MAKATMWPMCPSRTWCRDETGEPVDHPDLGDLFGDFEDGRYPVTFQLN